MKCVNCHNKMQKQGRYCDRCGFDMADYQTPAFRRHQLRHRSRWIAGLCALVVLVAVVRVMLVQTEEEAVATALLATALTLKEESDTMVDTLPLLSHLASMVEEVAVTTLTVEGDSATLVAALTTDLQNQNYRADFDVDGFGFLVEGNIQASLQHLTVQMDRTEGIYGVDLVNLGEDLEDFAYVDLSNYAAAYNYGLIAGHGEIFPELKSLVAQSAPKLLSVFQVEEVGGQPLTLNDESIEATGYQISWDLDGLELVLKEFGENLLSSEILIPYFETILTALQQYSRYLAPENIAGLQALWDNIVNDLIDYLGEAGDIQMIYLYEGRAVLFANLDEELSGGWAVALNPEGDILDYIALGTLTEFQFDDLIALSTRISGDALELELSLPYGEDIIVDYDFGDSQENLVIRWGYNIWTYDVDSSTPHQLAVSGQGWRVESVLGASDGWFTQTEDYLNLLHLTMADYFALAKELGLM